jgi:hypothetical protein
MEVKIGQLIKERVEASNMEVTTFANAINKERSNVYDIYKRDSIDTNLLKKIGHVLEYDFFQHFLEQRTIEKFKIDYAAKKARIMVEIEVAESELEKINFSDKIYEILDNSKNK